MLAKNVLLWSCRGTAEITRKGDSCSRTLFQQRRKVRVVSFNGTWFATDWHDPFSLEFFTCGDHAQLGIWTSNVEFVSWYCTIGFVLFLFFNAGKWIEGIHCKRLNSNSNGLYPGGEQDNTPSDLFEHILWFLTWSWRLEGPCVYFRVSKRWIRWCSELLPSELLNSAVQRPLFLTWYSVSEFEGLEALNPVTFWATTIRIVWICYTLFLRSSLGVLCLYFKVLKRWIQDFLSD